MFVYTVRPIKAGEQLFIENDALAGMDKQCDCNKCKPIWTEDEDNRLKSDPDYQVWAQSTVDDYDDAVKRLMLQSKLRAILNKHGRMPWSPAIEKVTFFYDYCMQKQYRIRHERKF